MRRLVLAVAAFTAPPHAFERPADYVNQPPLIGVPGNAGVPAGRTGGVPPPTAR